MRQLTIHREKSFVGCLGKMKIYIEDPQNSDLTIQHVPCRKLGTLKNGETKTFSVEETEAQVFVIADKLSKNYCNEYYQLSEGTEPLFLSGKNTYHPAAGNPFRFHNNPSEGILENRKRNSRKGWLILLAAILIGVAIGVANAYWTISREESAEPKTFSDKGMTIELTDAFEPASFEGFTLAFDSRHVAVFALKEEFSLAEGLEDYSLEQYAALVIQNNRLDSVTPKTEGGLTYFQYDGTNSETGQTYRYFSYVYKSGDAFWLVQFAALIEEADSYAPQIQTWAKSIRFAA